MAVTRTSTGAFNSSAAAFTAAFGVGATAGDLGILVVETANQALTTPTGWALVSQSVGIGSAGAAGGTKTFVYWKFITSGDITSGVAISDSGDHQDAVLLTYSGCDATTPVINTFFGDNTATTSVSITGAITAGTVTANDIALAIIGTDRDSATASTNSAASWANITGSNSFIVNASTATGAGGGIIINELVPSADQTGDATFSCTITSSIYIGHVLVLKAPASGTTVALTGQSLSGVIGSVLAAASLALSGGSLTASQGSVKQGAPITGQSVSVAPGTPSLTTTVALTGQALSASQGAVSASVPTSAALTGQLANVAQGSTVPVTSIALTGQSLSVARGSIAATTSPVLAGQAVSGASGSVSPITSLGLSGQSLTAARGTIVASSSFALSGQGVTAARGSVLASSSLALTGGTLTAARGTVTVSGSSNVTAALTGQSVVASQGVLTPAMSLGIAGQQTIAAQSSVSLAPRSVVIAGQTLAIAQSSLVIPISITGHIKVDLGGFIVKPVKVWDGSAWVVKPLKYWTGSVWRPTGF